MEVPRDPATAGWYHLGPAPGALGPAVIAGHVTWNQVPAVFFRLAELRQGDVVKVTRADDRVAVFEVTQVTTYAKSQFPTRAVFGGIDHAGLRLITCGGEFDSSSARYSDNVVAFATLVSTHRTGNQDAAPIRTTAGSGLLTPGLCPGPRCGADTAPGPARRTPGTFRTAG